MTDSYDRSYYEIALTNGQVLVALGILLACVVGAFLSGLWVAKKALDQAPVAVATQFAAEPESETFEFFGNGSSAAEPAGDSSTGLDAGPSGSESTADWTAAPVDAPSQSAPAESAAARRPAEKSAQQPARTAQQQPPPQRQAAEKPASASPQPAPDTPGARVIQVFSSNDRRQADSLVERLGKAGYRAYVSPVEVDGRTMHRVRVGPFEKQEQAEQQAAEIKRGFKLDTWITTG